MDQPMLTRFGSHFSSGSRGLGHPTPATSPGLVVGGPLAVATKSNDIVRWTLLASHGILQDGHRLHEGRDR
jgi:hypothetical protein